MTDDKTAKDLYFIGVSTGGSSILKVFPKWAGILGINAEIRGIDLPLRTPAAGYRRLVAAIRRDPAVKGALVTTHKIDLLRACSDMIDQLDPYAEICREVSCIAKVNGRLHGYAKDVLSSGLALDHFLPAGHWAGAARDVLCLGAGGAATAIAACLAERSRSGPHPRRFLLVDIVPERLSALRNILDNLHGAVEFEYHLSVRAEDNDALLERLPAGSLVINATGMGKDLPGSPLSADARFPERGLVWELNYRGEREFLRQAQAQAGVRNLTIEDGWMYFVHGWTQVIAEIFQLDLGDGVLERLEVAAALNSQS